MKALIPEAALISKDGMARIVWYINFVNLVTNLIFSRRGWLAKINPARQKIASDVPTHYFSDFDVRIFVRD